MVLSCLKPPADVLDNPVLFVCACVCVRFRLSPDVERRELVNVHLDVESQLNHFS